jgi:hypothetical protein
VRKLKTTHDVLTDVERDKGTVNVVFESSK